MSIARRPLIWVSIFDHLEGSFRFSCELIYTIEALKSGLAAFLLMKETEEDRLILKKRGQQRPLRDNLTLGSYGIVDGSGLDLEVTGGGSWLGYGKASEQGHYLLIAPVCLGSEKLVGLGFFLATFFTTLRTR